MSGTTNYDLYLNTGEAFAVADQQKLVKVLDRCVGSAFNGAPVAGVISGWSISAAKTITAGSAIVGGCYCVTLVATDISDILSANAVNYVYAAADATSPDDGTVTFGKVASPALLPSQAIQLGTIILNAGGAVTAQDDNPDTFLRDYMPPVRRRIIPQQTVRDPDTSAEYLTIEPGSSLIVEVDHSAIVTFTQPLALYITTDPDVNVTPLADALSGSVFRLQIDNNWTDAYGGGYPDYAYGYGVQNQVQVLWQRDGLV